MITESQLRQDYINNKLKVKEIAAKYNISTTTIHKYIKLYNLPKRGNYIDYIDKKIGSLYCISPMFPEIKGGRHVRWKCRCDCGEIIEIESSRLLDKNPCCKQCSFVKRRKTIRLTKSIWWGIKSRAVRNKNRTIPFMISKEYAWELFLKQDKKCAITGVDIKFADTSDEHKFNKATTASLDRIDSSKGYIKGNVQWVHKRINVMKMEIDVQEFISWCKKVVDHVKHTKISN